MSDIKVIRGDEMDGIVSTIEYYDMLIDEENDPFRDGKILKSYMSRWDGPQFYNSLNLTSEKIVLEVGVGTGRVAHNVLEIGCKHLTGIDISPKTIQRANENLLTRYSNVELLLQNIEDYRKENYYDLVYSVLTFMHVEDKEKALKNIVDSLKPGGDVVLSISKQPEWLDYGRKVKLFPKDPEYYMMILEGLNCRVEEPLDLVDNFVLPNGQKQPEYGQKIATIVKATKR